MGGTIDGKCLGTTDFRQAHDARGGGIAKVHRGKGAAGVGARQYFHGQLPSGETERSNQPTARASTNTVKPGVRVAMALVGCAFGGSAVRVRDPQDTLSVIETIVACLK
jgi:hypothetical protein